MKHIAFNAFLCTLLLVSLTVLTMGCSGVSEALSQPSDVQEIEKYIQEQLAFVPICTPGDLAKRFVPVQILAINDFHGQLTAGKKVSGRPVGSAPVLASYLREASKGMEDHTIIVHAGDLVGASPPQSALLQDEPTIMFFNMLGNTFCTARWRMHPHNNLVGIPGNHEFDEGKEELLRLVYGGTHENGPFLEDPYNGADFPFVCANVVYSKSRRPYLTPLVIKNIMGMHIAFIGAVLKDTPTIVTPSGVAELLFLDEADSINAYVKILKRYGIRAIVAVIHEGTTQASYIGATDPLSEPNNGPILDIVDRLDGEVDIVLSGHRHSFTNAIVSARDGRGVLVTQAWSAGSAYADIDLEIDRRLSDIVWKKAEIVTTWADEGFGLTPDTEVAALVTAAEDKVQPLISQVIGTAAGDIVRTQNAAGESALGNLIADAQRAFYVSDFAFMNQGGIRADISAGEVTWGELYSVQPFNNYLVRMELTGQQIYDLLNQQWFEQPYPRILQVSGVSYTWDNALPEHNRIVEVRKDGMPIGLETVYTVTVNSFLADGGDKFSVLTQGSNRVVGPIDLDALVDHVKGLSQPFRASIEGRIQRLN